MRLVHVRALFCTTLLLLVAMAATATAGSGPRGSKDAKDRWVNNPHSGAALNRDAAHHPTQAPPPLYRSEPLTLDSSAVNDPFADATAQDTQSETSLTALGNHVVVAFNDSGSFIGGASKFTGYSHSGTMGASFTDKGTLPTSAAGDAGDPNLAVNTATGAIYLSTIAFNVVNQIPFFKSTDGGKTFGAPVNAVPGGGSLEKEWMAVDNYPGAGNGNIYLCASDFGFSPARIVATHSDDGGVTWGPSGGVVLSGTGQSQGCQVAVGPDHGVYVAYFRGNAPNQLFVRKSIDGGVSFGVEHVVATLNTTSVNGDLGLNGGFRTNSFPNLAVDPANGELIVTYNDNTSPGDADIYATTSTDGGTTWSTPIVVPSDTAKDQYMPTVAIAPNGKRAMFGYYSRVDDPANLMFHRRARIENVDTLGDGSLSPSGRSFRLGPNNPPVIGQDPVINSVYMGDYDQSFAATNKAFYSSWADNRDGDSFHAHQPDIRFASIATPQSRTDVRIILSASQPTIDAGQDTTIVARVRSVGGTGNDVFLNLNPAKGLSFQSVGSSGNDCDLINKFVGCSMGSIADGTFEKVNVVTTGTLPAGTRTVKANVTSSSIDPNTSDDTGTTTVTVNPGSTATQTYSTGNIAVPINDNSTVDVPIAVGPTGAVGDVDAFVRLDHTFDADVAISLISPLGTTIDLSSHNGGGGDNYGSGTNDCSGTATHFNDSAATPITAGTAPFAGLFSPEQALSTFNAEEESGTWMLRVADTATVDTGTIGCVKLRIARFS